MRHRVAHRKLGRVTEHRIAMLRNQATALLRHERIETTVPKAKELRPFVERLITIAKRGLAGRRQRQRPNAARASLVLRDIQDRDVVGKLFDTIAPRFADAPGRLHAHPARSATAAATAPRSRRSSSSAASTTPTRRPRRRTRRAEAPKPKGVGGRLRAAAERLRGKKAEAPKAEGEGRQPAARATQVDRATKQDRRAVGEDQRRARRRSTTRDLPRLGSSLYGPSDVLLLLFDRLVARSALRRAMILPAGAPAPLVVRVLHVVRAAAAGRRREVLLVGEHLGHRHLGADDRRSRRACPCRAMRPRRLFRSPIRSPAKSLGA